MNDKGVCMLAGIDDEKEVSLLAEYAKKGCNIAFMDTNKAGGLKLKQEFEENYKVSVFFFHGDVQSEEDRDLFMGAICGMYGGADYIIGKNQ